MLAAAVDEKKEGNHRLVGEHRCWGGAVAGFLNAAGLVPH